MTSKDNKPESIFVFQNKVPQEFKVMTVSMQVPFVNFKDSINSNTLQTFLGAFSNLEMGTNVQTMPTNLQTMVSLPMDSTDVPQQ